MIWVLTIMESVKNSEVMHQSVADSKDKVLTKVADWMNVELFDDEDGNIKASEVEDALHQMVYGYHLESHEV